MSSPSVGELLHEASFEVRSIMWDVTALDGPALGAAWPAFAAHARDALEGVPLPDTSTRLLIHRAGGSRPRPNRWGPPVDEEPDPRLVRAGEALAAVADLLKRHSTQPMSSEARRDANLARRRIAECLFVGSHATSLGLREHANRLQPARRGIAFERPEKRLAVSGANRAQSRRLSSELTTFEAHLAHYLARPFGRELPETAHEVIDPDWLPDALARWEVTAQRVLYAQPPSVRDLVGIAHTEQALIMHTTVIMNAAALASVIDPDDFAHQVRPRLEDVQAAWGDVAASWPTQMTTPASPSLAGVEASAQLHRALGQITRDGNRWAKPALIAARVDLAEVVGPLRGAALASGSRSERFAELPTELARAGHLYVPARILAAMERHASGTETESAVRPTDVANRRIVAVQPGQTTAATATARDLMHRAAALVAALETIPLDRQSQSSVDSLPSADEAARGLAHASRARANAPLTRHAAVRR